MAGGSGIAVYAEVRVRLVLQNRDAVGLRDFQHMPPTLRAQRHAHRVLIDADRVYQLRLYALGHRIFHSLLQRVRVHPVRVRFDVDYVRALAQQHPQRAGVAELLDEHRIASVYERVQYRPDRAARAGAKEDVVYRYLDASIRAERLRDVLAQARMSLRRRVLRQIYPLVRHDVRERRNEPVHRHRVLVRVRNREREARILRLAGRHLHRSRQIPANQIRIVHLVS